MSEKKIVKPWDLFVYPGLICLGVIFGIAALARLLYELSDSFLVLAGIWAVVSVACGSVATSSKEGLSSFMPSEAAPYVLDIASWLLTALCLWLPVVGIISLVNYLGGLALSGGTYFNWFVMLVWIVCFSAVFFPVIEEDAQFLSPLEKHRKTPAYLAVGTGFLVLSFLLWLSFLVNWFRGQSTSFTVMLVVFGLAALLGFARWRFELAKVSERDKRRLEARQERKRSQKLPKTEVAVKRKRNLFGQEDENAAGEKQVKDGSSGSTPVKKRNLFG